MRILIAEDDLTSRVALKAVLEKLKHEVIMTVNGEEAWAIMEKPDAPQMAILDWMMPVTDGLEVVRRIRALPKVQATYIILLTSKGKKSDIIEGLDAGADDYLSKPFDPGELRARVDVGRRMIEMQERLAQQLQELIKANEQIKILQGIIPICSYCKNIRDDQGYWKQVEEYVSKNSDARFSHGICPECVQKYFPDLKKKS
jgi:phosphoserine phosphatase RsbU/P